MIRKLFSALNILLITITIFFVVNLFYLFLADMYIAPNKDLLSAIGLQNPSNLYSKSGYSSRPKQYQAYEVISKRDLFKTATDDVSETVIDPNELEETQLNLKLWGTVAGQPEDSYAIIEDTKRSKQGLYRKGDAIQNAEVKMILRKKVVLSVNGKDEILLMEEGKNKRKSSPSRLKRPDHVRANYGQEDIDESINVDRSKINSALKNINQLMSQVKVRPHFKDGVPSGLLLSHIQRNSIFKEMGLLNGDIVKGVNGKEIKSVDDALKFYENLKNSASVDLQIERKGEEMSIGYQID